MIIAVSGAQNVDSSVLSQMRVALAYEAEGILLHSYQKPAMNVSSGSNFLDLLGKTVFSPDYVLPAYVQESIFAEAPAQTVEEGQNLADVTTPVDLPAPIPLAEPIETATPSSPIAEEGDASRALLGMLKEKKQPSPTPTPEPMDLKDIPPPPDPDFVGSGWLTVKLNNGMSFIGQRIGGDSEVTVFQAKKHGTKLTLKNSTIVDTKPYPPAK